MALPVVREVGLLERYHLAISNAGVYVNVAVGPRLKIRQATLQLPQNTAQWIDLLKGPLAHLIKQHPALSVVFGNPFSAKPLFLRFPSIDVASVVRVTEIAEAQQVSQVLEQQHALPFDVTNQPLPLWRLVVAHVKSDDSFYLIYNFHHSIGDGRSAMVFTEQLLEKLNIQAAEPPAASDASSSTLVTAPEGPLAPPIEKRVSCRPSFSRLIKQAAIALFLPSFLKKALQKKHWVGDYTATLDVPHESQVGIFHLDRAETSLIVQAAKAHNNTVQSILFAASVFAVKAVFLSSTKAVAGNNNKEKDSKRTVATTTKDAISFSTPVTLRTLVSPPIAREDQGCYPSEFVTNNIQIGLGTMFWELAQNYRKRLVRKTQTPKGVDYLLQHVGLLAYLPSEPNGWEDYVKSLVKKEHGGRQNTLMISNLGRAWDQEPTAAFEVLDSAFTQSAFTTGPAITLGASTANGVLSVTATWQKAAFSSRDRPELYLKEFKRILLEATMPERKEYHFQEALVFDEK
ncbi:hypothetical protein BGZ70_005079 [Mortierella alpina]|uniref:Alcohol acetyltransferase n=1 Tax=Mortierella alpina TaxID=64518 RepID=A0A9P6IQ23_MORAP|nr:hypothetical protein BGZ70_005079 [Mortierella alpina]